MEKVGCVRQLKYHEQKSLLDLKHKYSEKKISAKGEYENYFQKLKEEKKVQNCTTFNDKLGNRDTNN